MTVNQLIKMLRKYNDNQLLEIEDNESKEPVEDIYIYVRRVDNK